MTSHPDLYLAVDTGSPVVSVAVGAAGAPPLAGRSIAQAGSAESLLRLIAETLREAGVELGDLAGLVALQGPGSFTGLRIGVATLLGLHEASGVPATAVPTFLALAAAAEKPEPRLAVVDALRGEWFAQLFGPDPALRPLDGPVLTRPGDWARHAPCLAVGFGVERLRGTDELSEAVRVVEPPPLAPLLLRALPQLPPVWDTDRLLEPLYLRAPAVRPQAG